MLLLLVACHEVPADAKAGLVDETVTVLGGAVHVLHQGAGRPVVMLHGASYTAQTWADNGTITALADAGYEVRAVDLPGHGASPANTSASAADPVAWLSALLDTFGLERAFLVSPSFSGAVVLPFLAAHPDRLSGLVGVAPVGVGSMADGVYDTPILAIWGENDTVVDLADADLLLTHTTRGTKVVLPGASHACYLDDPAGFHAALLAFFGA